jgi:hypothetical protein
VDTIRVPLWGTLPPGWTFLSGLPGGGMAVLAGKTEQVLLLDADLTPTAEVTIAGLRSVWSPGVSVCAEAGLVAVCFADGPRVYDLASGAQVHRFPHPPWSVPVVAAWTSAGRLLWAMTPTGEPGADELVVLDTRTWATVGRLAVRPASTNQAYYLLWPSPSGDQVAILDALADSDGFSLRWARWDGTAVVSPAKPLLNYELADVSPGGREFAAVTDGLPNELEIFAVDSGESRDHLELAELAGDEELEDSWSSDVFWLGGTHLVARTEECHLLLLRRGPLRMVAQLELAGYHCSPFGGAGAGTRAGLPYLTQIQPWSGGRFVTSHHQNGTRVSRIYDLAPISTVDPPGAL